ncbi:hypothetical protein [Bathymodiolus thermophilus thioautotrophic gill symbiont]|nr:hypothetical protein [Bathymodiolus thermophilus thioautotrophic gill symbiont]
MRRFQLKNKEKTIGLLMKDLEGDFLTDGLKILRKIDKEYHIEDFAKANKKNSDKRCAKNHDYSHLRTSRAFYYSF